MSIVHPCSANVAGIELENCKVNFNDNGRLEIETPPGVPATAIGALKSLPESSENPFSVQIECCNVISATFHQCWLKSFEAETGAFAFSTIDLDTGNETPPSKLISHCFRFGYMTLGGEPQRS